MLATSDSNIAVDNLLEGLVAARVNVLRLGRPENTRPELLRHCLEEQLSAITDPEERALVTKRAIEQADVICTTCVGAGSGILTKKTFAAVLIDEASQATETATCAPLFPLSLYLLCCTCLFLLLLPCCCFCCVVRCPPPPVSFSRDALVWLLHSCLRLTRLPSGYDVAHRCQAYPSSAAASSWCLWGTTTSCRPPSPPMRARQRGWRSRSSSGW